MGGVSCPGFVYNVNGGLAAGETDTKTMDFTLTSGTRIVAGTGHVHGGAERLTLTQPNCSNRQLAESQPTWGLPDHPFYNATPILHEPGPINMSSFKTPTGIPVARNSSIRLSSVYEGSNPHVRVMGIMVLYTVTDTALTSGCPTMPGDVTTLGSAIPGTPEPPDFTVPLTGLDAKTRPR